MEHKKTDADEYMEYMLITGQADKLAGPSRSSGKALTGGLSVLSFLVILLACIGGPIALAGFSLLYGTTLVKVGFLIFVPAVILCCVFLPNRRQIKIASLVITALFSVVFYTWYSDSMFCDGGFKDVIGSFILCLFGLLPCLLTGEQIRKWRQSRTEEKSSDRDTEQQ